MARTQADAQEPQRFTPASLTAPTVAIGSIGVHHAPWMLATVLPPTLVTRRLCNMPAEIHTIEGAGIAAAVVDLEDGQAWNDEVVITMRRDEANMVAVIMSNYLEDAKDAIRKAERASARTDIDALERIGALLAVHKLSESWQLGARGHAALGVVIAPASEQEAIAKALAEVRAKADAEDARAKASAELTEAEAQTEPDA